MDSADHALAVRDARDHLKTVLRAAFRAQNAADLAAIMTAVDALYVAERAADRAQMLSDRLRMHPTLTAIAKAREETARYRRETRQILGEPEPRTCTRCHTAEGDTRPDGRTAEFYPDKKRRRPHCIPCELDAGAAYRARKAEEAARDERRLRAV